MTIFDLLFILLFLASVIALISILILLVRARRMSARRLFLIFGSVWAVYLAIVFLVAAATPQRVIPMNEEECYDEMCFSVAQVQTAPQLGPSHSPITAHGIFYVVTVKVASHSRGRTQGEGGIRALLWNSGKYYEVSPPAQRAWEATHAVTPVLTARLRPDESILSDQVFDVPARSSSLSLVLSHGFGPGYFVIGECPLFHPPTILRLE